MMLFCVFAFFEHANFELMDSFLGVHGSDLSYSAGSETPLMTTDSYATIHHPMYRALTLLMLLSFLVHPHTGQLLFVVMLATSFILFVPIEERLLINARGEEYKAYMEVTRYRIFRGYGDLHIIYKIDFRILGSMRGNKTRRIFR